MLMVAVIWYLVITSILNVGQGFIERYYARGERGGQGAAALAPIRVEETRMTAAGSVAPPATAPEPLVRARNVHKSFGDNEVLKGIDLDVMPGEAVVILGPSGSGKSHVPALHQPSRTHRARVDRGRGRADRLRVAQRAAPGCSRSAPSRRSAARSAWSSSSSTSTRT